MSANASRESAAQTLEKLHAHPDVGEALAMVGHLALDTQLSSIADLSQFGDEAFHAHRALAERVLGSERAWNARGRPVAVLCVDRDNMPAKQAEGFDRV